MRTSKVSIANQKHIMRFEKRRRLIPLIMKSHYKPDGWLGFIASGRLYVDFVKSEFSLAYDKLKIEIQQHCHQNTNQAVTNTKGKDHQNSSMPIVLPITEMSQSVEQYPNV